MESELRLFIKKVYSSKEISFTGKFLFTILLPLFLIADWLNSYIDKLIELRDKARWGE